MLYTQTVKMAMGWLLLIWIETADLKFLSFFCLYEKVVFARYQRHVIGKLSFGLCCEQVVGMTASVGTGQARDEKEAIKHILQLCAQLDAKTICDETLPTDDISAELAFKTVWLK